MGRRVRGREILTKEIVEVVITAPGEVQIQCNGNKVMTLSDESALQLAQWLHTKAVEAHALLNPPKIAPIAGSVKRALNG